MRVYRSILVFGFLKTLSLGVSAFSFPVTKLDRNVSLKSSMNDENKPTAMYPINPTYETIQGGGTVRTYQMPEWATRAQMAFKTNGRPLRVTAQLWIGPLRTTHTMNINSMDGSLSPYMSTITFKKLAPNIRIISSDSMELPVEASVWVPPPERSAIIGDKIEELWNAANSEEKKLIQGADVEGGHGAVRTWQIPSDVKSVQIICWSKDTSKKSLKARIEVLQGPNNKRQDYDLQCGGSTQPFHCVFQTPGNGWMIRAYNKKFVEDGLFEMVIAANEYVTDNSPPNTFMDSSTMDPSSMRKKEWWQ